MNELSSKEAVEGIGNVAVVVMGLTCVDEVVEVENYPTADQKVRAIGRRESGGGNGFNTATWLAATSDVDGTVLLLTVFEKEGNSQMELLKSLGGIGMRMAEGRVGKSIVIEGRASETRAIIHSPSEVDTSSIEQCWNATKPAVDALRPSVLYMDGRYPELCQRYTEALAPMWRVVSVERVREGQAQQLSVSNVVIASNDWPCGLTWEGLSAVDVGDKKEVSMSFLKKHPHCLLVIVTLGAQGSLLVRRRDDIPVPFKRDLYSFIVDYEGMSFGVAEQGPPLTHSPVHPNGAGDAFAAGVCRALSQGMDGVQILVEGSKFAGAGLRCWQPHATEKQRRWSS